MPVYRLSDGDDLFEASSAPGWADGSQVFGLDGNDTIGIASLPDVRGSNLLLDGGRGDDLLVYLGGGSGNRLLGDRGDDTLRATGSGLVLDGGRDEDNLSISGFQNTLLGDRGDDTLSASGLGNTVDGGRGDDLLVVSGTSISGLPGNVLRGGRGEDTFRLTGESDLGVANDIDGVVSQGDVIGRPGAFDVIADHEEGERVEVGAATEVDSVGLAGPAFPPGFPKSLVLLDGTYAILQGRLTATNLFTVDEAGDDLLIVFDRADGSDAISSHGSVVLRGVTDADTVWVG